MIEKLEYSVLDSLKKLIKKYKDKSLIGNKYKIIFKNNQEKLFLSEKTIWGRNIIYNYNLEVSFNSIQDYIKYGEKELALESFISLLNDINIYIDLSDISIIYFIDSYFESNSDIYKSDRIRIFKLNVNIS